MRIHQQRPRPPLLYLLSPSSRRIAETPRAATKSPPRTHAPLDGLRARHTSVLVLHRLQPCICAGVSVAARDAESDSTSIPHPVPLLLSTTTPRIGFLATRALEERLSSRIPPIEAGPPGAGRTYINTHSLPVLPPPPLPRETIRHRQYDNTNQTAPSTRTGQPVCPVVHTQTHTTSRRSAAQTDMSLVPSLC